MLFYILLGLEVFVSIAMVGVILLQRSEGGALGMGGGSSSFMTARGAGNLLTRTTGILAAMFFGLAIGLTILGNVQRGNNLLVNRLGGHLTAAPQSAPRTAPPPLAGTATPAPTTSAPTTPDATGASGISAAPSSAAQPANDPLTGFAPVAPPPTTAPAARK